ncbi:MAG TPA: hypothetical protein VIF02_08835 [Methylocella sp.]|jgi:4-hydroxybenzoate polyprenyltransferase
MSIADNFDHKSDAGFVRAYDARAARRQFQVSSMLVLVLLLSAIALGILAQLGPQTVTGRSAAVKTGGHHIAETLLDIRR